MVGPGSYNIKPMFNDVPKYLLDITYIWLLIIIFI